MYINSSGDETDQDIKDEIYDLDE